MDRAAGSGKEGKAMNRRQWLQAAGVAGIASAGGAERLLAAGETTGTSKDKATVSVELKRLNLRHTWTTTMSSSTYRDTVNLRYTRDAITGHGEGAPIVRYRSEEHTSELQS